MCSLPFKLFLILEILLVLVSCKTVQKAFHKDVQHIDSIAVSHRDSAVQLHIDTTKSQTIAIDHSHSVTVYFQKLDSPRLFNDTLGEAFYKGSLSKDQDFAISYDPKTKTVHSNMPIKKAVFKDDDDSSASTIEQGINNSIAHVSSSDSNHTKKQITQIDKTVQKKGIPTGFVIGGSILLFILIVLFILYKNRDRIFGFLKIPPI